MNWSREQTLFIAGGRGCHMWTSWRALLAIESLWLSVRTSQRNPKVWGSIPHGDSEFFSLAHARDKTKNIFLYFFAKLKTYQEPWIFDMTVEVAMKQLWIWNQKTCSLNEMVSPFIAGCGGMLNGTSGTFRSPGYLTQLKYDDNLDCSWTLLIPSDGYLTLIFVEFETEEWWVKIYQPSTCNLPSPLVRL